MRRMVESHGCVCAHARGGAAGELKGLATDHFTQRSSGLVFGEIGGVVDQRILEQVAQHLVHTQWAAALPMHRLLCVDWSLLLSLRQMPKLHIGVCVGVCRWVCGGWE